MLVLSRMRDESIVCRLPAGFVVPPEGFEIVISPVDIRGDKVRIGIDAPETLSIHREEVQNRIDDEFRKHGELP